MAKLHIIYDASDNGANGSIITVRSNNLSIGNKMPKSQHSKTKNQRILKTEIEGK